MFSDVTLAQYIVSERQRKVEDRARLYHHDLVQNGQIRITERRGVLTRIVAAVQGAQTSAGAGHMAADPSCQPA
jgi:hypothetical protein